MTSILKSGPSTKHASQPTGHASAPNFWTPLNHFEKINLSIESEDPEPKAKELKQEYLDETSVRAQAAKNQWVWDLKDFDYLLDQNGLKPPDVADYSMKVQSIPFSLSSVAVLDSYYDTMF